ncbi:FAD-binding protein [Asanoa sp. WMMD1127]|uniref:FAD-binding oxidoreductase n=1 Tax=Asanoa sp. WMMD1127 TaxID=3016107 RepID=UPI002416B964|nr:FAD-binding protein [Asanoa sp. WMMD1127]MDG4823168.1 FAD-binding protein [Asanoa sp. WMMD1127]
MTSTLSAQVTGPVLAPYDEGYADEVAAWNRVATHTPDLVVGAASADDVAAAVRYARDHGLHVTVQGTGHGAEASVTSGLMITTKRLDTLTIDPATRTATIGAGQQWGNVVAAAAEHGLLPISGAASTVGVVGLLVGGGLGPLARSHGYASDYVESFTVVTGQGEVVEASGTDHADLYWALRGGKWGLGIVTEVRVRLVELTRLYAGSLMFEGAAIEPAFRAWVDYTATADDQVSTSAAIIRMPPFEQVPEPLRGRTLLTVRFAYPGDVDRGASLAAPLRAAAPVYLDGLGELPAGQIARIHNDPTEPGASQVYGLLLDPVDQDFATAFLAAFGPEAETPFVSAELRHLGGAAARDVEGGSAVAGRAGSFACSLVGVRPDFFDKVLPDAAYDWQEATARWVRADGNANLMGLPVTAERLATMWSEGANIRLGEVRWRYDPDGVFAKPA